MSTRASAKRYARALFDVALEESDPEQAGRDLAAFADMVARHAELAQVLTNPAIPAARKRGLVEQLASRGNLVSPVKKLLGLLAHGNRLALLALVNEAYQARLLDHLKIVHAEVATAVPLGDEERGAIERGLGGLTGRTVSLTTTVDPGILGGVVARIGSTVYDGSLKRQLERMREKLAGGA
jgi:F-type H+-transporting ATPase subunit delta